MVWFFDREQESLRVETRYDNDASEFVVVVRYPDGSDRTERFATLEDFRRWVDAFDRVMREQHWASRKAGRSSCLMAGRTRGPGKQFPAKSRGTAPAAPPSEPHNVAGLDKELTRCSV